MSSARGPKVLSDHAAPGNQGRLHALRLAEPARRAGARQHAELRVPRAHGGAAPQLPAGVLPGHLERPLRPDTTVGRHDMKFGGEYLRWHDTGQWQLLSRGEFMFTANPAGPRSPVPRERLGRPDQMGPHRSDQSRPAVRPEFRRLDDRHPASDLGGVVRRYLADEQSLTVNYGIRWDADWGALDPPYVTTQAKFNPVGGAPYPDIDLGPGDQLYPDDLRDIGASPRAADSPGTWAGTAILSSAAAPASISASQTRTRRSASSRSTASASSSTRSRTTASPASSRTRPAAAPTQDFLWAGSLCRRSRLASSRTTTRCRPRGRAHRLAEADRRELGVDADLTHWKGYNFARSAIRTSSTTRRPATTGSPRRRSSRPGLRASSSGSSQRQAPTTGPLRARQPGGFRNNWQAWLSYTLMLFMNDNTTNFQYKGTTRSPSMPSGRAPPISSATPCG